MADRMGSYRSAFYLAGSTVMLGAAIPFILLFINRERAHHGDEQDQALHPRPSKRQTAKSDSQESELPFYDNPSFVGNLGTNLESPCNDAKRTLIDTSLAGVNDNTLPSVESENLCSGNTKSVENGNNPPFLLDSGTDSSEAGGVVNQSLTDSDDLISNDKEKREIPQSNTYQVEVEINSPLASTSNMGNQLDGERYKIVVKPYSRRSRDS